MSGTPYLAGSASAASGGSTTLTVPISTSVNQFDTIFIACMVSSAGVTVAVSDSQGNGYSQILTDTTETAAQQYVFESDSSNPLAAGVDTVTVVYSTNASVQGAIVVGDNNVSTSDKAVITHGSGTAMASPTSGTLSQVEEHCIGFYCDAAGGGNPSALTGTTTLLTNIEGGTTTRLTAAYTVVNATTAVTAGGTITSAVWSCGLVTTLVNPVTVTLAMSDGVANEAYSQTLEATGGVGTYTWTETGTLPTGLSLVSGVISGTPTVAGTYTFTTTATDSHSQTGTLSQSVTILASGAGGAAALTLPNNLLTAADSDFETTGFTWAADTNAGAPARSSHTSLTGSECLEWAASADGDTRISTGFYTVLPSKPYIASAFVLPCGQRDTDIGIEWYTSGNTLIRTDIGPDNPSASIAWQPIAGNFTSPSNAAKCKIVVEVQEANKGDVNHIDLAYFTQTNVQVLVDWINPTFADGGEAGQDFMDVSPFVRMDQGITISRGRQDSISEIQPGSATFQLQNDTGVFTRLKSEALPAILGGIVTIQRRAQINLADENGVWYTRFDGPISEIDYSFDNTGLTSIAVISVTDVLAYLNRQDDMTCWTKEQVLADGPWLHWSLDDAGNAGGSGVCAESSGNNGPAMRLWNSDNSKTGTIAFQDTTGGVETLADAVAAGQPDGSEFWTAGSNQPNSPIRGLDSGAVGPYTTPIGSVYLTPKLSSQGGANYFTGNQGYQLQTTLPETVAPWTSGQSYSFECWFTVDPTVVTDKADKYGPFTIMSLGTSRQGTCLVAGIYYTGGTPFTFTVGTYNQPPAFLGKNFSGSAPPALVSSITQSLAADAVQIPHHLVVTISGDPSAPTVSAWLDGNQFASTFTLPTRQYYDTFVVGGAFGGDGCHFGNVSLASIYQYQLSATQIAQHCQLGQYGMWETTTDDCVALLTEFANIPSFWLNVSGKHNGLTLTEYQDITGSNALTNMQLYEQAEHGLLYVDATGALNFHTRDWRMGYGAPDLQLPPDTFDSSMGYELIDQFMQNEDAIATQTYQTGSAYVNATSQAEYGTYAVNPVDSPLQLPLITFNRAYSQLGLTSFDFFSDPNLDDLAAWNANIYADPWLMPGQLTFDLLTMDPSTGVAISDFYALEIDNLIAPSGTLPSSFPDENLSMEWFIEGVQETITNTQRNIQFYTSPAETQRAWIPGDSTYGVLGSTARIGISQADINQTEADGKDVSHDAGRPYWAPTFSSTMNSPSSQQEFVVVQNVNAGYLGNAGSFTVTLNAPTTEGNTVIAIIAPVGQQVSTVKLGTVDTFSTAVTNWNASHTNEAIYVMYDPNCSGGQNQVNITLASAAECFCAVLEVEGILATSPVDQTANSVSGSTATTFTSGLTSTTVQPTEFLVGGVVGSNANAPIVVTTDWTSEVMYPNWVSYGYKSVSVESTYQFSGTGNDFFGAVVASFEPAATATNTHGFVGAVDIRGLTDNLSLLLSPPMCVVGAVSETQSQASGTLSSPQVFWDTVFVDTVGGMGAIPGWPNWYCCLVPGFYEIDANLTWSSQSSGQANTTSQAWIIVAQQGAQLVATGGSPLSAAEYVCPIGESSNRANSINVIESPSTRMYLGLGDLVTIGAEQDTGSTVGTGTNFNGSSMSLRWVGYAAEDDRVQLNSTISGGSVSQKQTTVTHTKTYTNTNTYSYYGAAISYNKKNQNGGCYQGTYSGGSGVTGSESSQIVWPHATINSDLTVAGTVAIKSVTLKCKNQHSWYDSGAKIMLGYSTQTPGGSTFNASTVSNRDVMEESFDEGQTKTFSLPSSFAETFQGSGKMFILGNSTTTNLDYYGYWQGGAGNWTLTIEYTVTS